MFIAHFGIGLGAKKFAPAISLGALILASQFLDLLWPSLLLGLFTYLLLKSRKYAMVIFLCVLSHWFLDLLVHRPDLPLIPGDSPLVGLGLWNYPAFNSILEAFFFFGGVWLYQRATIAKNKFGKYGFLGLVSFLILIQVANTIGPAPTEVSAIAWAGQAQWILVVLALFVDRNRRPAGKVDHPLSITT